MPWNVGSTHGLQQAVLPLGTTISSGLQSASAASDGHQSHQRTQQEIRQLQESNISADLFKIDTSRLPELKREIGVDGKDLSSLTVDEKVRYSYISCRYIS